MPKRQKLCLGLAFLALACAPGWGQGTAPPTPIPIAGGDELPPVGLINQFFPGVGTGFDGPNAEPGGITHFKGHVAMGYTLGTATDNKGNQYGVITDIRVYQGNYIGGVSTTSAGGTSSAKGHGTFVEV